MDTEQIGKIIKKLRLKNKLTQKEFAEKLGVTYQAVSKWETGKNIPDIVLLKEISIIFDVDINELLTGKSNGQKNIFLKVTILFLLLITITFLIVIVNHDSDFEFKTITSNCDEFELTGSVAYNNEKSSIYITNVDYCGRDEMIEYSSFECNLYEIYKNTKTKIGTCGNSNTKQTLNSFLDTVQINVNNYKASCKMFSFSTLYMEIHAIDDIGKKIQYQIPMNLEDNCK